MCQFKLQVYSRAAFHTVSICEHSLFEIGQYSLMAVYPFDHDVQHQAYVSDLTVILGVLFLGKNPGSDRFGAC